MRDLLVTRVFRWSILPLLSLSLAVVCAASGPAKSNTDAKDGAHTDAQRPTESQTHAGLVRQQIARQPITFFPASTATPSAAYESHLPGYDLQIRPSGMTIQSQRTIPLAAVSKPAFDGGVNGHASNPQIVRHLTQVEFLGANLAAHLEALDPARAHVNLLIGNDPSQWQHDLPTYARVRASQLYPGIDLVYYGSGQGSLEYDLVLAPHADLQKIRFRSSGDDKAILERDGSLELDGKDGSVRLQRPVLYQDENGDRKAILGNFVQLAPGEFGFQAAAYDHNRPLIVDPTIKLLYATYAGGIHDDVAIDMTLDVNGNAYVVGTAASEDFPVTGNALQSRRSNLGYDAAILKFDASGNLLYSTFLGGTNDEAANSVVVNPDGSVYVGGWTRSGDFPLTSGAYQKTYGGGMDAFLAKISNDGSQLLYSTFLGGAGDEQIQNLLLNTDGSLWIGGDASAVGLTPSANAAQKTPAGNDNMFFAKAQFAQTGALQLPYLTFLGGPSTGQEASALGMAVDSSGNLDVGGISFSGNFPVTSNAYEKPFALSNGCLNSAQPNSVGTFTSFSSDLSKMLYSTVIGGHIENQKGFPDCNQAVRTVRVDPLGNIWLIGTTGMQDFPVTSSAIQSQLSGNGNAGVDDFIVELSPDGTQLLYGTYFGGTGFDYGGHAVWDSGNHLWLTAATQSTDYRITADALQMKNAGGYDTAVTEFSPDGTSVLYSTYLGGSGDDDINGTGQIRLDAQGNVHLSGSTTSTDYPTTPTAVQPLFANGDAGPDRSDMYYAVLGTGIIGTVGPVIGGNTGDTTVTISGAGFQSGASCQLALNGTTLTAGTVSVSSDGTKINCTFSLNGATAGAYDVTITNPNGGASFTRPAAFTVQSGGAPNMWVNIVARSKIRTGVPTTVTVTYGNSGNVDAYMSHLVVTTPANIQSAFVVGVPPNLPSGMQVPTTSTQGGLNSVRLILPRVPAGSSGSFQMAITDSTDNDTYNLSASIAKPWFTTASSALSALTAAASSFTPTTTCASNTAPTNCLGVYLTDLKTAGATSAQIGAIANTLVSTLQQVEKYGSTPVINGGTTFVPPSSMVTGTLIVKGIVSYDNTLEYHISGVPQQNTVPISSNCVNYAGDPNNANGFLMRCTLTISAPTGTGIVIAGGSYGIGGSLIPSLDACFTVNQTITGAGFTVNATAGTQFCALNSDLGDNAPKVDEDVIDNTDGFIPTNWPNQNDLKPDGGSTSGSGGTSGGSIDPNGKTGPQGDGSTSHFVKASGALAYNVYFENEATASLPAAQVVVSDQLDATKVDLSTVTLGPVTFGTNTITPPSGSTGFAITYRPPSVTSYVVRAQGSVDKNAGLLKWTFTTLDPTTNLPPSDPSLGFLPPDTDGVVGQGGVTFNVTPLPAAQTTGTQITNGASVVFDANAAILTPTYLNTLDADAPISAVKALPAVETISGTATTLAFPVAWTGTDKGAGIKSYTIFVADNNGDFIPWQTAVTITTANYTGTAGHTYGFYSIATDGAGNVEAGKVKADTTTVISSLAATTTTLAVSGTPAIGSTLTLTATVAPATGSGTPTGQISFMDGLSTVIGTAPLSSGKATLTTSTLALGGHTVTAVYGGDSTYASSTSSGTTITVTPVPSDFSIALSSTSASISGNGGSATSTVSLTPAGGFSATVTLACSGLPARTACTFSPVSLTASGTTAATSTLTITTNTATAALQHENSGTTLAFLGIGTLGLSFIRRRRYLFQSLAVLCLLLAGWGLSGCGGSPSATTPSPTTPAGTYTVTITATSGSTLHSTNFNLAVQ
jgi:Bacterial Ig-like domain (group 3)